MTNDFEKQTSTPEESPGPKWEVVAIENGGQLQKLGTMRVGEPTEWTGARLKRDAKTQAAETYPPVDIMEAVELLANDPDHPLSYTYARLLPDSADCYHVVVNDEEATVNVAQSIPMSGLSITVGTDGVMSLLVTGTSNWGGVAEELPDEGEGRERLEMFARCREAAAKTRPEAILQPRKTSRRRFGGEVIRRLRNR